MPSAKPFAKVLLDADDEARLNELCEQSKLSRSEVFRRLLHNLPLPSQQTFQGWDAITEMMKVNADLARLGNLQRMALAETDAPDLTAALHALIAELSTRQAELKDLAVALRDTLQPRRTPSA